MSTDIGGRRARINLVITTLRQRGPVHVAKRALGKIWRLLWGSPSSPPPGPDLGIPSSTDQDYDLWLKRNYPRPADLNHKRQVQALFSYQPTISIIMPVYNPPAEYLRAALDSVLGQIYPHWELCLADDASSQPQVRQVLTQYQDPRIKVIWRSENGHICHCSNSALTLATGEFIALLDHDDCLRSDALYEVALALNQSPQADIIYSDEDKIDDQGRHSQVYFKPDWCPDTLLSRMYLGHLVVYRRTMVQDLGGFRPGFEGAQDWDLALRLSPRARQIVHIPQVLYHWRLHPQSTSRSLQTKQYAWDAGMRAVASALGERGEPGRVEAAPGGHVLVRYHIREYQLVSVVIPTRDLGKVLHRCLKSIFTQTTYPNYEVVLVDNGTREAEALAVMDKWQTQEPDRCRCYPLNVPFNFALLNNYGVAQTRGNYLLFLNNDTEVITPDWMTALVEQAQRPAIGAVGAMLLYPDNTIQHAGVVVGIGGVAGHSHKHYPARANGYFNQIQTINNYLAVTAACLMCRRSVFAQVGGFEETLTVAFNDIDLCLKLFQQGYRNVYLPHVKLYHHESKSRGYEDTPEKQARFSQEIAYMEAKWASLIAHDPCYSPHLTLQREDYSLRL